MASPLRLFTKTEYTVAFRFSNQDLLSNRSLPFSTLDSSKDYWYADPFPYKYNGQYYIFMEMMKKDKGYAGIGVSEWKNNSWTTPKMIIDTGSHLSFPLLFAHDSKLYMMPESSTEGCIQIFECDHFPYSWHKETIVLDDAFWDSVPFEWQGKPYLFSSKRADELYGSELFLFSLEPEGTLWKARDGVSLSKDFQISRMAGNVLQSNGKTYRVAQDCSNSDYGKALVFSEILSCSLQHYEEKKVLRLVPKDVKVTHRIRGKAGIHTYNRFEDLDVIDFKIVSFSLKSTILKIRIVIEMLLHRIKRIITSN